MINYTAQTHHWMWSVKNGKLREAFKKNYLDREIVPIPSYTPTIETG